MDIYGIMTCVNVHVLMVSASRSAGRASLRRSLILARLMLADLLRLALTLNARFQWISSEMSKICSITEKRSTCEIFLTLLSFKWKRQEEEEHDFFLLFKGNFSKCHTFTLTHTVMDCYLSSFHSARENANLIMMIFFLLRDNVCVCVCVCVCV